MTKKLKILFILGLNHWGMAQIAISGKVIDISTNPDKNPNYSYKSYNKSILTADSEIKINDYEGQTNIAQGPFSW